MKKITLSIAALALAIGLYAATKFEPGLNDGGAPFGCRITGAVVVSTNASETCTVKAVYELEGKIITNEIYQLTCENGVAVTNEVKFVAPNAKILVEGEIVYLFQE